MQLALLQNRSVVTTPTVDRFISEGCVVAIGVSGGKDSSAVAFATCEYLDSIGHPHSDRVLIHSDLGSVEWKDSLPCCERLASRLDIPLIVCRRAAGGMMERWETRWHNNVLRYINLECVKLILPWSTAAMRFCTSELKTAVICRELIKRFPGRSILSVTGIRRQESRNRAKAEISKDQPKLQSRTHNVRGHDWNPIIEWTLSDVLTFLGEREFPLHPAYTDYGSSRVSCAFCILGSRADLKASTTCPSNHAIYRRMVALEVASTFSFQDSGWLGDVAPHLLGTELFGGLCHAKQRAFVRECAEEKIPDHLLYTKGWPTCIPTRDEAELLCDVRRRVGRAIEIKPLYTDAESLIARYRQLMAERGAA